MTAVGPFISLDNETDTGERTNWCTTQTWWTSTSIQFTGTATNATAKVGNSVTIQVEDEDLQSVPAEPRSRALSPPFKHGSAIQTLWPVEVQASLSFPQ